MWTHIRNLGNMAYIAMEVLKALPQVWKERGEVRHQILAVGVQSVSITLLTALFTGMVLALETAYALMAFGAKLFIGEVVGLSLFRELGPVLTALMVGGRVGAGVTAELGAMTVTQQVDALRVMAVNPFVKLVMPRTLAILCCLPLLSVLANGLGLLGGLVIAKWELQVSASFYLSHVWQTVTLTDLFTGLYKSVFFALTIALVSCYNGLSARGGASSVGVKATETVVMSAIAILMEDYFLTKFIIIFQG